MLRWVLRLLYVWLWGRPEQPTLVKTGSNSLKTITYGNVRMEIFLNHSRKGQPYYKIEFRHLARDGRSSPSFFVDDLKDLVDLIGVARAWIHDSNLME